jgi:hypothetical protein
MPHLFDSGSRNVYSLPFASLPFLGELKARGPKLRSFCGVRLRIAVA